MPVREVPSCSLVAADVSGRACPSIEGEQRQLLGGSGALRARRRGCGWLGRLGVVSLVRLCTYELGRSEQSVADRAEAAVLGTIGVDLDEAGGAKSPKGSSAVSLLRPNSVASVRVDAGTDLLAALGDP